MIKTTDIARIGKPEYHDTQAEEEGTLLHSRVVSGKISGLSQEQADIVRMCIEMRGRCGSNFESEKRFNLDINGIEINGAIDTYFPDCGDNCCAVIDWKFGRVPVDPPAFNVQMVAYAIAAMISSHKNRCIAYIFQPRVSRNPVSYEFADLASMKENLAYMINSNSAVKASPLLGKRKMPMKQSIAVKPKKQDKNYSHYSYIPPGKEIWGKECLTLPCERPIKELGELSGEYCTFERGYMIDRTTGAKPLKRCRKEETKPWYILYKPGIYVIDSSFENLFPDCKEISSYEKWRKQAAPLLEFANINLPAPDDWLYVEKRYGSERKPVLIEHVSDALKCIVTGVPINAKYKNTLAIRSRFVKLIKYMCANPQASLEDAENAIPRDQPLIQERYIPTKSEILQLAKTKKIDNFENKVGWEWRHNGYYNAAERILREHGLTMKDCFSKEDTAQ